MRETMSDGTAIYAGTPWWSETEHAVVLTDGTPDERGRTEGGLHRPWLEGAHRRDLGAETMHGGSRDRIIPGLRLPVHVEIRDIIGTKIVRARWDVSDESRLAITEVGRSVGEVIGQLLRCETMAVITEPDGSRAVVLLTGEYAIVHAIGLPRGYWRAMRRGRLPGDPVTSEDWLAMLGEARRAAVEREPGGARVTEVTG